MIRDILPISVALICPHLNSYNCKCRKPNTGLILKYRSLFPKACEKELYVGDQATDQQCSEKLKIPFVMVHNSTSIYNKIDSFLEIN